MDHQRASPSFSSWERRELGVTASGGRMGCGFRSSEQNQNQSAGSGSAGSAHRACVSASLWLSSIMLCGAVSSHDVFLLIPPCPHLLIFSCSFCSPGGSKQKRLKVSLIPSIPFHHLELFRPDSKPALITSCSCQCPTLSTWLWMRTTLAPGGCRICGGKGSCRTGVPIQDVGAERPPV